MNESTENRKQEILRLACRPSGWVLRNPLPVKQTYHQDHRHCKALEEEGLVECEAAGRHGELQVWATEAGRALQEERRREK